MSSAPTHSYTIDAPAPDFGHLWEQACANPPLPGGGIILAATPLGNPQDASIRLLHALATADVIAAEDTRRSRALADALGVSIRGKVLSNFDHNEEHRAEELVDAAADGQRVLIITDAGMPSVSDPGFPAVVAAHRRGVPVTCLPGPSAVPTALALSGVGVGHFRFLGFAPRKDGQRRQFFDAARSGDEAVCFFESPHRLAATLGIAAEVLGTERAAAVCRELTKTFEEVKAGTLGQLAEWAAAGVKGEVTVVIEATAATAEVAPENVVGEVEELVEQGRRLKAAAGEVAASYGLGKRDVYEAVLAARAENRP